jgi:hypothetical protein
MRNDFGAGRLELDDLSKVAKFDLIGGGEGEKWPFLAAVGLPIRDRTDANFVVTFADRLFHEDNLRLSPRTRQSLRAKLTFRRAHAA